MSEQWKSFEEWITQVLESMRRDPLWSFQVYPKTLFLADLVWKDTDQMIKTFAERKLPGNWSEAQALFVPTSKKDMDVALAKTTPTFNVLLWGLLGNHVAGIIEDAIFSKLECLTIVSICLTKLSLH